MIKKIEDLDHYEILNLPADASPKDIENAYLLAVATYHQDGLASYGMLMDKERAVILERIEAAFQTLRDPKKRKAYDAEVGSRNLEILPKASFRRSTDRLLIEDAAVKETLWGKFKSVFAPSRHRRESRAPESEGSERNRPGSAGDSYYYGDYLRKVRERRGVSLEEIAEKCGVDPLALRLLEEDAPEDRSNGEKNRALLRCYAKSLGLDPENGGEPPFPTRFH